MSKRNGAYWYWLAVVGREQGVTYVQAEDSYKPCAHPGRHRVMMLPTGPVCPGCKRACHFPAAIGLQKDDEVIVLGKARKMSPYDGDREQ